MPKRWPSVRGHREKSDQMPMISPAKQNFDFAFNTSAKVFVEARKQTNSPTIARPNTSAGEEGQSKKKKNLLLDPLAIRPRSSDGNSPIFTPKLRLARLEDGLIGLAFGSPGHPPEAFSCLPFGSTPDKTQHAVNEQGPFPNQSTQVSRWKKFGGLFRSKSLTRISKGQHIQRSNTNGKKLGLPIQRKQWRNPGSPEQDRFPHSSNSEFDKTNDLINTDKYEELAASEDILSIATPSPKRPGVPKLEIQIPPASINRRDALLKKFEESRSSQLLARRNQNLTELDTTNKQSLKVPEAGQDNATTLVRPSTSPAMSNSPALGTPSSISKYSLFPTQVPSKVPIPPSALRNRLRASTLPSEKLALQQQNVAGKEQVLNTAHNRSENVIVSPGDVTASSVDREAAPWGSMESVNRIPSSRTSIDDEIFFDVKSFRDSNAIDDQQFVMTRPDSAAVQLARSNSNARKAKQAFGLLSSDPAEEEDTGRSRASIQIEEAIAIVERLTNPSTKDRLTSSSATHLPLSHPAIAELDANETAVEIQVNDSFPKCDETTMLPLLIPRKKSSLRTRMECMNIDVPSPVIELAEEASPHSPMSRSLLISPISLSAPLQPQSESTVSQVSSMTPSHDPIPPPPSRSPPQPPSNRSSSFSPPDIPPPVPAKDTKFIPISKFAAKNTAELVIERTGLYPRNRPSRSTSVTHGTFSQRVSSLNPPDELFPFSKIQRSTTMPMETTTPSEQPETSVPDGDKQGGYKQKLSVTTIAYVQPTAEVSVARKISLSRRPSQKVQVSGTPSRKGSQKSLEVVSIEVIEGEKLVEGQKAMLPILKEVEKGHKPGRSMDLIVELACDMTPRNSVVGEKPLTCRESVATSLIAFGDEDENLNFSC